jgi:CubicO group peptidase (beta-lactamase class C family)
MTRWAAAIDAAMRAAVDNGALPFVAYAVVSRDGVRHRSAVGNATSTAQMTPGTMVWIASMTKALTAAAAMQLVEQGRIGLDDDVGALVPEVNDVQVLDGDHLRPPASAVTLRQLLTHTSGYGYDWIDRRLARAVRSEPGSRASYDLALASDPGTRWSYGVGIDWAGCVVEAISGQPLDTFVAANILTPLGMHSTVFRRSVSEEVSTAAMWLRTDDGLVAMPSISPNGADMVSGGGGAFSTVDDYVRFLQMLLGGGQLDGVRVLSTQTVETMFVDHIAPLSADGWTSNNPVLSCDVSLFPGQRTGWGVSWAINTEPVVGGRAAGSAMWAGLPNCYYWVDRASDVAAVFVTQLLPFWDPAARAACEEFERLVYAR